MKDDFHTQKPGEAQPANSADQPEDFDDIEMSELPPTQRSHHLLLGLSRARQRVLATAKYVSRATWQDIVPDTGDGQELSGAGQADENDFELQLSELPPTRRSHFLLLKLKRWLAPRPQGASSSAHAASRVARRQRHRLAGRVLSVLSMGVVLLALLFSTVPELRSQLTGLLLPGATPTPVSYVSTDLSGIDANVPVIVHPFGTPPTSFQTSPGPIPATCPAISTLQYFTSPLDPPGLGDGPVWISGFSGPSPVLDRLIPYPKPGQGWYQPLTIFIQKGFGENITVQGSSQSDNQPIWLSKSDSTALTDRLFFNLNDGTHYLTPFPKWEMTSITLAVPASGCYSLQVTWPGHAWKRYFAAGA